ncbi:MAG: N-acetylmuramoyl-L-alanine amidase [Ignavibacteriaceae bacterium]|nr:N-acetylmuramoyl-L-alanine amidase [Ignavibacteriaceae bacterium]
MKFFYLIGACVFFISGCSQAPVYYFETPRELTDEQLKINFIEAYSPYLKNITFFVDAGHGGEDRRNKGSKGLAIEADVNLRVALALRNYLRQAGVRVIMSRDKDKTVALKDRSILANKSGADIFISIHSNAPGQEGDNSTNYTSTYYHATESDYEFEPMEKDLAKYVQRDLAYAMRNSGGLGSFDGTYSDYHIYPKQGFSVLRLTTIPSILVEAGFHTSTWEEPRLALEDFNKIEAWGIFRGLCRYFKAGIPKISFKDQTANEETQLVTYSIQDSTSIDFKSIKVFVDSTETQRFTFDEKQKMITVELPILANEEKSIRIIAANKNGNFCFPFYDIVTDKLLR